MHIPANPSPREPPFQGIGKGGAIGLETKQCRQSSYYLSRLLKAGLPFLPFICKGGKQESNLYPR